MPLLDAYYELRGWNPTNGWPTEARLRSLGLDDVAQELARRGRLG
jgi:aldehyde:ferredoxin oxidoreductase